jgi:hypothetical protein
MPAYLDSSFFSLSSNYRLIDIDISGLINRLLGEDEMNLTVDIFVRTAKPPYDAIDRNGSIPA